MQSKSKDIAIIGMSLNLPDALSQEEFYENLRNGKDSIGQPPTERLKYAGIDPTQEYKVGAFINRVDLFDHKYFNIGKKEAEFMDPTQRILLELAVGAIENAGYSVGDYKNSETALYLCSHALFGMTYQAKIGMVHSSPDPTIHTGSLNSMICGRIAYFLGLTGPAVMIDTGCSSSLVALNEAVEKLQSGRVNAALVGGLVLKPGVSSNGEKTNLGASSDTGRSRAFAADADGIGVGEGGGLILIKRLEDALKDKDPIQAVIKGIGVTQDGGRCNSIAAPSPVAQTEAIRQAWTNADIDPGTISFVETHGAGTHLGDVIEVQALTDAFSDLNNDDKFCALGAVKTNIGHIGNTAGMAGLIKAVIGLKKKELFSVLHYKEANPFIDFDKTNVFVNTENKVWQSVAGEPLRCGVSSFGLSGTNAHVVLEEAPDRIKNRASNNPNESALVLKIAARSQTSFEAILEQTVQYLNSTENSISDVLYTLNAGREDASYRRAFYGGSTKELIESLQAFEDYDSLPSIKQKDKKVVLLLSPGAYQPEFVDQIGTAFPIIATSMEEVRVFADGRPMSDGLQTFAFHYGLYRQLEKMGIGIQTMIGSGIGSKLAPVISGNTSLKDMVDWILENEIEETTIDETKFKQIVKKLAAKEAPVFVDLGATQSLASMLNEWKKSMASLKKPVLMDTTHDQPILDLFTQCYNEGVKVDWDVYYKDAAAHRVEAPTYVFDPIRCWYADPFEIDENDVSDLMYATTWKENKSLLAGKELKGETFLVFDGKHGLGGVLQKQLSDSGNTCILVNNGDAFMKLSDHQYLINFQEESDYLLLKSVMDSGDMEITGVVHLGNVGPVASLDRQNQDRWMDGHFVPQYLMAKVFSDYFKKTGFQLVIPTTNGQKVLEDDIVVPFHGLAYTFTKSLLAEFTSLKVTYLDMNYDDSDFEKIGSHVLKEMASDELLRFSAIREDKKYTPHFTKCEAVDRDQHQRFEFESGNYLVTGGSSGLGLETCKAIAQAGNSEIHIVGKTILPAQTEWSSIIDRPDHEFYEKIQALTALQNMGAKVTYHAGDVADVQRMTEIIQTVKKSTPNLTGVIHSAGVGNTGTPISEREIDSMKKTLQPKVNGSIILEELTREMDRGFFVSFSSIATIVPSSGGLDYACANGFEDSYAEAVRSAENNIKVINWSDWKETGLAHRKRLSRSVEEVGSREEKVKGLSNAEGVAAIKYVLRSQHNQLAVANMDLSYFAINPYFTTDHNQAPLANNDQCESIDPEQTKASNSEVKLLDGEVANETEKRLIAIWHEVLKLDAIRLDDDFYDLGGHSLNITLMLNKVKQEFGVELEMDVLLEDSSVRVLSAIIDSRLEQGTTIASPDIKPLPDQEYYDISHAQKRFWILSQQQGSEAYNVPSAFLFTGQVDIKALEESFKQVVERHECLRTTFHLIDGVPKQKISAIEEVSTGIEIVDLKGETDPKATGTLLLKSEAAMPFDLANDLMLRLKIFILAKDQYLFFMNMHHIVADATSIMVLRREALTRYKNIIDKSSNELQPLAIQYKDFAAWQNELLSGENLKKFENYWSNRLNGISPKMVLPTDREGSEDKSTASAKIKIVLSQEEKQGLQNLANKAGTTLFNTVLAIFSLLLYKYSSNKFITVGTPVSGRENEKLHEQIGIYLNTLLLRTEIDEEWTFLQLLHAVHENMHKDLAHQTYPYDLLTEHCFDDDPNQRFNVGFTWTVRQMLQETLDLAFDIQDVPTGFNQAKNELWLFGVDMEGSLILEFLYKTSLFDKETIELMAERLKALITQFSADPDELITHADFGLLSSGSEESSTLDIAFNF